jgi:hypothetical protein
MVAKRIYVYILRIFRHSSNNRAVGVPHVPNGQKRLLVDRHSIAAQMNADLAKGWWIWRSPNKVEHLVEGSGKCAT